MSTKLTIIIPCYNQISFARRCLSSLSNQTFKDFLVIIRDDNSRDDYKSLVQEFSNLNINYIRNEKNLGAIGNMVSCLLYECKTEFIMCLHEDDFLNYKYLENVFNIFNSSESILFVGSRLIYFKEGDSVDYNISLNNNYLKLKQKYFTNYILKDNNLAFGSIVYKKKSIESKFIDLKKYSVFFDRPFLLNILQNGGQACILLDNYYFYHDHGYPDNRWDKSLPDNLLNLHETYFACNNKSSKKMSTNQVLFGFVNLINKNGESVFSFIKKGRKRKVIFFRSFGGRFFWASIFILLFGKKFYYHTLLAYKSIFINKI
jgi:GT2 family glycosyltransferase